MKKSQNKILNELAIMPFLAFVVLVLPTLCEGDSRVGLTPSDTCQRKEVRCIIHLHSNYTSSSLENNNPTKITTLEEIIRKARDEKIDVVIPTDHASGLIEFKPFPLLGILSIKKKFPSVIEIGPEKYLLEIARLNQKYPEITVIPGVEATSDYWWEGKSIFPFNSNQGLILAGWHRHLLVVGLENPADYYNLPVPGGFPSDKIDPLLFWPLILVTMGWVLIGRRPIRGCLVFIVGLVILWGNYPFVKNTSGRFIRAIDDKFSRNEIKEDPRSFQRLIDYTRSKGGLTFWAHPEAKNEKTYTLPASNIKVISRTGSYAELLARTSGYNGFAIFAEGYRTVGNPGGLWDQKLMDYCAQRDESSPPWAISELDYGGENFNDNTGSTFAILQNVIWLPSEKNNYNDEYSGLSYKEKILQALRKGRFYALWKRSREGLVIKDFYIQRMSENFESAKSTFSISQGVIAPKVVFGETLRIDSSDDEIKIYLDVRFTNGEKRPVKITVINDGKISGIFESVLPCRFIHRFKPFSDQTVKSATIKKQMGYVRLFIDAGYPDYIATNPVFYSITPTEKLQLQNSKTQL